MLLPDGLRDEIVVDGLLGAGPPFLAQIAIERRHVDLYGQERTVALSAAGTGWDRATARLRCWAEMVERFMACAPQIVRTVVVERNDRSDDVAPWWAFASYGPDVARRLDHNAEGERDFVCAALRWGTGVQVLVPASRVILAWQDYAGPRAMAGECDATGLAAGADRRDAALHGLREVLERDAAMMAWRCARWPVQPVETSALSRPARTWIDTTAYEVRLVDVARPGLDPVVLALLYDGRGGTVGTACATDRDAAADAAVLEAAMLRSTVETLGPAEVSMDVVTSLEHVRFGYRHTEHLQRWFDRMIACLHPFPDTSPAGPLAERVATAFGTEPLVVDLAEPPLAPFAVVRVLLAGAMRKEWRHDLRSDASTARGVVPSSMDHDLPHPFG